VLALILAFGKKFIFLIIAAFVGLGAWINRRFMGGGDPPVEEQAYYEEAMPAEEEQQPAQSADALDPPADPRPAA
jgi:hypothetical protein